ncbi:hypothetical protein M758_UG137100 [Ceratodon purpureus]|nr:hypothetical protein M758_UG137100 [Ceratodon purpureus]KAG0595076.1 hypothetical protein M758_UG137100 [Ceratodon purpureus]
MMQRCTKVWYKVMLCLPGEGFVPFSGSRHLYGKLECQGRLGPSNQAGAFPWKESGGPEYTAYVSELYERVYQKPLSKCVALPWHFARGILAEEDGLTVDWAQYAISLRRGRRQNRATNVMKKYRNLREPLPFSNPKTNPFHQSADTDDL